MRVIAPSTHSQIEAMILPRIVALFGLFVMIGLAWLMSSHRRRIPARIVIGGLILQFTFAVLILKTPPGQMAFDAINFVANQLNTYVEAGSGFLFHVHPREDSEAAEMPPSYALLRSFAFGVLPTVIFFASLMSVLYYLGVMQVIVKAMAWLMQRTIGTSGTESLAAAANVFVGHTEAPLVVRPFINSMTRSELNAMMVGGFATITGGLIVAFKSMGIDAGHLVTASVISAPAALLIAKVMLPETEKSETLGTVDVKIEREGVNIIEAAAAGASEGMKLALNIAAVLLAFLALIALVDAMLKGMGELVEYMVELPSGNADLVDFDWSLQGLFGFLFAPLAWLIGVQGWHDCIKSGELLGIKMVANEFVAYHQLGTMTAGDEPQISERTKVIMTYALSGFSNFGAIGIQIGGIGGLAPERRSDLARLGLRAMIGGMLACCMTACIAGMLI